MVECGGLENRLAPTRVTGVRIPPPPPGYKLQARETVPVLFYDNNKGIRTEAYRTKSVSRLGASTQVDALFSFV